MSEQNVPQRSLGRRVFTFAGKSLIFAAVSIAALVVALMIWNPLGGLSEKLFGGEDKVSSAGVTLMQLKQTTQLKAATGSYSVPVFLENENRSILGRTLPNALSGERVVAIYQGSVDATIDLSQLAEGDLKVNQDTNTLTITVPAPVLSEPNLDEEKSKVVAHTRGVLPRLGDVLGNAPLEAREKLDAEAVTSIRTAAEESGLRQSAKAQGRSFLTALGRSLGYSNVTVEYRADQR